MNCELIDDLLDQYQDPNIVKEHTCANRVYFRTNRVNWNSFRYEDSIQLIGGVKQLQKEILVRRNVKVSLKQIRRLKGRYKKRIFDVNLLQAGKFPHNAKYWTSINVVAILSTLLQILKEKDPNKYATLTYDNLVSGLREKILINNVEGCDRMLLIKDKIINDLS
jgi:hypothetical protein